MLRQTHNLRYLDLSHTGVSDFAFRGYVALLNYCVSVVCKLLYGVAVYDMRIKLHVHVIVVLYTCISRVSSRATQQRIL